MLSFRFDLTAAQVRVLMDIYAGNWIPEKKSGVKIDQRIKDYKTLGVLVGSAASHFVTIVGRLASKGLVVHTDGKRCEDRGFICTEKGKTIARMIAEDAARIVDALAWAEKRGVA